MYWAIANFMKIGPEKATIYLRTSISKSYFPLSLIVGFGLKSVWEILHMWVCVCGGFLMCGYFDNCVDVLVICVLVFTAFCIVSFMYRMSQEEWTKLRESVPYVELYRYNPKHLYPKLNGYWDNGHRKVWASGVSTHCTPSVTPYSSTAHARQRDTAS